MEIICRNYQIILIALLLGIGIPSFSQTNFVDSVEYIAKTMKGEKKLRAIADISNQMYLGQDGHAITNIMRRESLRESNHHYLGYAYLQNALNKMKYLKLDPRDSIQQYLDLAFEQFSLIEDSASIQVLDQSRFTYYLLMGKNEMIIQYAKKLINNKSYPISPYLLYHHMGVAYICSRQPKEGKAAVRKSIEIVRQNLDESAPYNLLSSYATMITAAQLESDYDEVLIYSDSIDMILKDTVINNKELYSDLFTPSMYCYQLVAYVCKKKFKEAKQTLDKLNSYLSQHEVTEEVHHQYVLSKASYYYAIGNYSHALELVDLGLEYYDKDMQRFNYIQALLLKSDILNANNKSDKAYELIKKTYHYRDSISSHQMSSQMAELQTIYETDKLTNKIKTDQVKLERTQIIVVALVVLSLLLMGFAFIIRRNSKIRDEKNRKLYDQKLVMDTYQKEIRNRQREELEKRKPDSENENNIESLADKADQYLEETLAFKNTDFSRNDLALALGTNRQYLIHAIREKTGVTFRDYINNKRLEYARQMLTEDFEISIETVYKEAGFPTRSTFNRLFRQQYGMNPNELRRVGANKNI